MQTEKKWYEKSFRRNLVDMHIDDWDERFLSEFDPQAYFECLKEARIQSTMIYLQSHVGLCNWDTKTGRTHRAFVGNNKVKTLIDLCHREGMDVIAYYSLIYNNQAYDAHPDWRIVNYKGEESRKIEGNGGRYGYVCPNNQEYREFLKEQFREISETYEFEGIYLDMTFWPFGRSVCECPSCRERYRKETGCEIPEIVDWNDPGWKKFQKTRQEWIGEFAAFCTAEWKKLKPEVAVIHQSSGLTCSWHQGVDESVADANDYVGGDLYGGYRQESYVCKLFRELSKNQPFEYQTSRCDPELSVHTMTKTPDFLRLHTCITMAHHGAVLFIDAIDPVGTINPEVYRRIGQVFGEMIPYEKYMTGDLCSEVALILSMDSKFDSTVKPGKHDEIGGSQPQLENNFHLSRVLNEMRMPYTVLTGQHADRLKGKDLALISEAAILRENQIEEIASWVENGGNLYISGCSDPRLAEKLLGLKICGLTKETRTYQAPTAAGAELFGSEYSEKYPLPYTRRQVLAENPQGHTVLAKLMLPYTDPSDWEIFASIHSNPPGEMTEWPAMILGNYGSGKVFWCGASLERENCAPMREFMKRLIRFLAEPQMMKSDAPACVEFTLFKDEEKKVYYLHAVNIQEELPVLPVGAYEVRLKINETVTAVKHLPDEQETAFAEENGEVVLKMQGLKMFDSWMLCYE